MHTQINNKWRTYSLAEQLGNIGSEVGRAIHWQKKNNKELRNKAVDRALDLLNQTIADPRWHGRRKELIRAKNIAADFFYGTNEYQETAERLEKYFFHFALNARKNR